jgi:ribosomal protein S18 acetylase RimI-like enzyme
MSGPETFGFAFGSLQAARRVVAQGFTAGHSAFSHRFCRVAARGSDVVGIALAYRAGSGRRAFSAMPRLLFRSLGPDVWLRHLPDALTIMRLSAPLRPDDYFLSNLAVLPENRGRGVGSLLLAQVIADARSHRCRRVCVDVEADNRRAVTFYQRSGFTVESLTRSRRLLRLLGKSGMVRMNFPV